MLVLLRRHQSFFEDDNGKLETRTEVLLRIGEFTSFFDDFVACILYIENQLSVSKDVLAWELPVVT